MSLTVNHNMMAANAARNLTTSYGDLATSVQRLSSGLRINSAADDAAGLAIREMMRSDIATTQQGLRNAADAISMIQTADGALAVIDEKLIRMKELAEQAATGTYTTAQRDIINSEYQQMANEIDRIANATNFNGIKLLDGSVSNAHGGQGIKIHFGVGNNSSEDYYFVNMGDARATSFTGLRVGGDAKNDIWGQGAAAADAAGGAGCCASGFDSLDQPAGFKSGSVFAYGYNWDWKEDDDKKLLSGKYTAGMYQVGSSESLQNLIDKVNMGTQSRVGIHFSSAGGLTTNGDLVTKGGGSIDGFAVCVGDEAYVWGSANIIGANGQPMANPTGLTVAAAAGGGLGAVTGNGTAANTMGKASGAVSMALDSLKSVTIVSATKTTGGTVAPADNAGANAAKSLTSAINNNANSAFWAMYDTNSNTCYVFAKEGGDKNALTACELPVRGAAGDAATVSAIAAQVDFENVGEGKLYKAGTNFSLGGEHWGTMKPTLSRTNQGFEVWNVTLNGRDVGDQRDLWIANVGDGTGDSYDFDTGEEIALAGAGGASGSSYQLIGKDGITNINGLSRDSFIEIQNAADGNWAGAEVRTQSSAQEALDALGTAIDKKDKIRADLGAMQNRLENTMSNLEIQAENLQASESRISDVDVATEMTEFTRNNVLTQAATSMLAQANSLSQLALSLMR